MNKSRKDKKEQKEEDAIEKDAFNEMFDFDEDDTDYYENKWLGD